MPADDKNKDKDGATNTKAAMHNSSEAPPAPPSGKQNTSTTPAAKPAQEQADSNTTQSTSTPIGSSVASKDNTQKATPGSSVSGLDANDPGKSDDVSKKATPLTSPTNMSGPAVAPQTKSTPQSPTASSAVKPTNMPATSMNTTNSTPGSQTPPAPVASGTTTSPQTTPNLSSSPKPKTTSPPNQPPTSNATVTSSGGGGSKFNIILIILGVLALLTVAGVGYLYFTNQNLMGNETKDVAIVPTATPTPTPIPQPTYEIINGSVYKVTPAGDELLLVDKANFEETGITGFVEVSASPDETMLCFLSLPPALDPALYVSDIDGQNVTQVSERKVNCTWSPDSKMVFYVDDAPSEAEVDIFGYDFENEIETNYTEDSQPEFADETRVYEIGSWDQLGTTLSCTYEELDLTNDTSTQGSCQINMSTGEFADLSSAEDTPTSTESAFTTTPTPTTQATP